MPNKWKDVRWKVPEPDEPSEDVGEETEEEPEPEADIPEEIPEEPDAAEEPDKPIAEQVIEARMTRDGAFALIAKTMTEAELESLGYDVEACKAEKLRILRGE